MEINDFNNAILAIRKLSPNYSAFKDVEDGTVAVANALGIISGYGDGMFSPNRPITRQEAAKMLLNVYRCYAEKPDESINHPFSDKIADWSLDAVKTMFSWNIMSGVGDNRFDAGGEYTVEQSIATFLRLSLNAPVSRSNANINALLTFDESIAEIESQLMFQALYRFDLEDYTVICGETVGVPHGPVNHLWIIYKEGGRRDVFYQSFNARHMQGGGWSDGFSGHLSDFVVSPDEKKLMFNRADPGSNLSEKFQVDLQSAELYLAI
ncbi:MAG: S-layer homology domain-containing protein [Clostridiales bacterium]|nr:S-layer homology domain-containing protein [Clostridiales bacterium]